jgi:hypothetical protein
MSGVADLEVVAGAGTLRHTRKDVPRFPHRWTPEGVTVDATFTGAHLLHLAVAGCVLNDVYREAQRLGVPVDGVRVRASGGFNTQSWQSTGIKYVIELDSPASAARLKDLLRTVDAVAEIPKAIGLGATVERVDA